MKQPAKQTSAGEIAGLTALLVTAVSLPVYYFGVVENPPGGS